MTVLDFVVMIKEILCCGFKNNSVFRIHRKVWILGPSFRPYTILAWIDQSVNLHVAL